MTSKPLDVDTDEGSFDTDTSTDADAGTADGRIDVYHEDRHRNGDTTAVLLMAFGGGYQALALDVDAGGQLLEIDEIGDSPDREKAVGMCEYWLDQNPKGVLGGEPDDGGGILSRLLGGEPA